MAFDIEGKLYKKFDIVQIKETFKKREFVLELEDGNYPQLIKFQLVQANCEKLDPFNEGDMIKVTFSLKGREYTRDDKTNYFTNLDAWRLDKVGGQTSSPTTASIDSFPSATDEPSGGDVNDDLPF